MLTDKAHRCWSAESCSSAPCANARRRSRRPSAFASSSWIGPITMVMPLVAASALSLEVPDSVLRHSTHAALLNPISPRSVCPSGRSSARSEASPAAHRQPHTILNTRAGMVREVPRDTNKHDCGQSGRRELHHRAGSTIRQIGCVSDGSTEPPRSQHYDPTSHL